MEKLLDRKLKPTEIIHHIDMDEENNPEDCSNFCVFKSTKTHMLAHSSLSKIVKELLGIGIIHFEKGKYIINQPFLK